MSSNEQIVSEDYQNLFRVNQGMWIFIFIDFLLFAGLLAYHFSNGGDFQKEFASAQSQLLFSFGVLNSIILFTSGLTMGLSKVAAFNKNDFLSMVFIFVTLMLAMLFLANRAIDCAYLFEKGFLYGTESFVTVSEGIALFFTTYFVIYFIFMVHLLIGIVLLIMSLISFVKNIEPKDKYAKLNFTVIYWSYLTMIWVFIFPILFLI